MFEKADFDKEPEEVPLLPDGTVDWEKLLGRPMPTLEELRETSLPVDKGDE